MDFLHGSFTKVLISIGRNIKSRSRHITIKTSKFVLPIKKAYKPVIILNLDITFLISKAVLNYKFHHGFQKYLNEDLSNQFCNLFDTITRDYHQKMKRLYYC